MKTQPPTFTFEEELWQKGYRFVLGMDEVGRGAFAGPVVVAAVVFEKGSTCIDNILSEVHDSKLLSAKKRQLLAPELKKICFSYAISEVSVRVINKVGIGKATQIAFRNVLSQIKTQLFNSLHPRGDFLATPADAKQKIYALVDGFYIPYLRGVGLRNQKAIVKGDQKSVSIAAASILAKVYRDNLMENMHSKYLTYNFKSNKGYGTAFHRQMIKEYGITKVHRVAFCD
jgi:ribonuclease HII